MGVSEGGSAADLAGARAGFAAGMTASEAGRGIGQLGIGIGMESEEGQYWVGVCFSPSGLRAGVAWRVCSAWLLSQGEGDTGDGGGDEEKIAEPEDGAFAPCVMPAPLWWRRLQLGGSPPACHQSGTSRSSTLN
jgi:hypothetical protein